MKVKCIDNHIGMWVTEDRRFANLTLDEVYEVDYEFIATNGLHTEDMYYLKDKGPFEKKRFLLVNE